MNPLESLPVQKTGCTDGANGKQFRESLRSKTEAREGIRAPFFFPDHPILIFSGGTDEHSI